MSGAQQGFGEPYIPTAPGRESGQGDSAVPPNGVEGIWTLAFGGPRKVIALETEQSPSFLSH